MQQVGTSPTPRAGFGEQSRGGAGGSGPGIPRCEQAALGKRPSKEPEGNEGTIRDFRGGAAQESLN